MFDRIKRFVSSPAFTMDTTSPQSGFVIGFLLGPLGVALLLRRVLDFLLAAGVCAAVLILAGFEGAPLCWLFCGAWTAFRLQRRRVATQEVACMGSPSEAQADTRPSPGQAAAAASFN
jgi:hypothetical protein